MTSTVYALANGDYLVISAAGIRTHVRRPRTIEAREFGPPRHWTADEVARDFRDLADAFERAGNATAPIMATGLYRSEIDR